MEENVKKSITIDGLSLSGSGGTRIKKPKRDKTARKIRPSSIVQPSTLKKTLLERIKQHQRIRERGRDTDNNNNEHTNSSKSDTSSTNIGNNNQKIGDETFTTNFSQSMDFLKKLALKKQQQRQQPSSNNHRNHTQRHDNSNWQGQPHGLSSSAIANAASAKTPEARMLNQVAETLTNGEIITNTGVIGFPVHYKDALSIANNKISMPENNNIFTRAPLVHVQASMPSMFNNIIPDNDYDQSSHINLPTPTPIPIIPKIADLADMYNNTIASTASTTSTASTASTASTDNNTDNNKLYNIEAPIHVPEDPVSYLPSIFIKEEPPHGCLKQGKKPTFREWATKMLKKPVDTIKEIFGGGSGDGANNMSPTEDADHENNAGGGGSKKLNDNNTILPENTTGMRVKIRKTLKKKFRVGKHDNVVGVLLKNKEAQRHIQKQHLTLKQKSIGDIKKHLYEKNLLKIGSNAPPDVLRRLYEDSILTGDVKNTSSTVLLHNFFSNDA